MDFGIADDGERTSREQAAQIAIAAFADIAEPVLASTHSASAQSPIQAEKSRPDRKTFGSATPATEGSPRPDPRQVYRRAAGLPRWIGAKS